MNQLISLFDKIKDMKLILFTTLFLFCCSKKNSEKLALTFKGSNTSNEVVNKLSKIYNTSRLKKIEVKGGGSEKAIKDFLIGDLFYLNSSRKLKSDEIQLAESTNDKKVKEIIIALDAIAIIVNPKLGVHELNLIQISSIFQGKIKNWKELGGPNLTIQIYGRKTNSGTCHFIKEKFVVNEFAKTYSEKNNSNEIIRAVKSNLAAISYVDLSSISSKDHFPKRGIWAINISIEGGVSVSPFERLAVLNGKYPLSRPLYQYIVDFEDEIINDFIRFELSDIGQQLIEREGFFKILPMQKKLNSEFGF